MTKIIHKQIQFKQKEPLICWFCDRKFYGTYYTELTGNVLKDGSEYYSYSVMCAECHKRIRPLSIYIVEKEEGVANND